MLTTGVTIGLGDAGNNTPVDGDDNGDFGFGTTGAAANDQDITAADENVLPETALPYDTATTAFLAAIPALFDGTSTSVPLFISLLVDNADVGDGASDVLLASFVLQLVWVSGGDF